ncbi:MAG: sodium:solute symporter family protein [Bacteroidota bacterium]
MVYLILLLYFAFTFWGSLIGANTKNQTPESYFLANRNLGTLALFFTILATNFSAFYFIGFAGEGYRVGYAYYFIMAFGTAFAALSFFIIGHKVWQLGKDKGYLTPPELIYGETGSQSLRYLYASIMVIYTLPYLALQIIGGGYILENLTGGQIPYLLGTILLTVFTIAYVLIGGMTSVAKTDLKQGLLAILFMLLAVIFISRDLGGLAFANEQLFQSEADLFQPTGKGEQYSPQKWFSLLIVWLFCIPMFPQLFMRFYIARDLSHLRKSALLYAGIPLVISLFPVIIGVLGHLSFPGLEGKAADQILPMMLVEHTTDWFAALVMTGAIAAFMSTLDSQLLALSTIATRDFYLPISQREVDFKKEVAIGRVFVAIFALIGLFIAFKPFATIFDMGKLSFAGLAILFPLTLFILRVGKVNPAYGIASIGIGQCLLLSFYYGWLPKAWLFGFESFIPILLICFLIVGLGTRRQKTSLPLKDEGNKKT